MNKICRIYPSPDLSEVRYQTLVPMLMCNRNMSQVEMPLDWRLVLSLFNSEVSKEERQTGEGRVLRGDLPWVA